MSLAATPKFPLDKAPCNIGKAGEEQPCIVTDDNLKSDCYESMHAFKKIRTSTSGLRKSPNKWTKEENQKLASLVAHYGEKKWKRISAEMGGQKTGAQCAQHWKRVLSPEIRKGHWDENEEDLLLRLVVQYGSCWKKIAKKIPQRTDIQCRYQYLKAKQSREVKWDAKEDESLIKKVMEMANCNFFKLVNDRELASCNFFKLINDNNSCSSNFYDSSGNNSSYASSLANHSITSPAISHPIIINNKENESDNNRHVRLSSSSNSDLSDDRSMISSEESSGDDGSADVSMSDSINDMRTSSSSIPVSSMENDGASYIPATNTAAATAAAVSSPNNSNGLAMNKVVWLEIAEHMARMKLTSTLRTALECKTRFMELLGNIILSGGSTTNQDSKPFDLRGSGAASNAPSETRNAALPNNNASHSHLHPPPRTSILNPNPSTTQSDTNINININNASDHNNNHISITNFSRNITINITNGHTNGHVNSHTHPNGTSHSNSPPNNPRFPQNYYTNHYPSHATSTVKTEGTNSSNMLRLADHPSPPSTSSSMEAPPTASTNNTSGVPFPSFPHHFPPVAQPLATTAKPTPRSPNHNHNNGPAINHRTTSNSNNNIPSGLESLAAVASILPREMLADYAQF